MDLKLLNSDQNMVRVVVMGKISRDCWATGGDPLGDLYGKDIYTRTVLLSLTESLYIDSTGVEWLLICHRRFEKGGGRLIVHSANRMAREMLKMMRVDKVLHVVDDEAAAYKMATEFQTRRDAPHSSAAAETPSHINNAEALYGEHASQTNQGSGNGDTN